MPSTYSTRLRFELIATGEQPSTWGVTTNVNLGTLLEEAIAGVASVTHDDSANYNLTAVNGLTDEARQMVLEIGGALTAARNVVCPTVEKLYVVKNSTTGGFAITIKTSGGSGISVPNGSTAIVYCDGTNVVDAIDNLSNGSTIGGVDIVGVSGSQTLTDKTLTSPTITTSPTAVGATWADLGTVTTVVINGGTITGITDLAVADGGSGASTAAGARANFGAGAVGDNLFTAATAAAAQQAMDTEVGVDVQAFDATLASLSGLGSVADRIAYTTGIDTWAETPITAFGRSLIDDADAGTARTTLGLVIGTDVQAQDATLASIAALGTVADRLAYTTGIDTWAETPISAFGRSLIDDAAATNARTTLGSGATGDSLFTAATAAAARTTLGLGSLAVQSSIDGTDIILGSDAQGDLLYRNATQWTRLPAGTSGDFLQTQGAAANPQWATPAGSTTSAKTATTSGLTKDFTGIGSDAKEIVYMFEEVSLAAGDDLLILIGDSGGFETTGYVSFAGNYNDAGGNNVGTSTAGFVITDGLSSGDRCSGSVTLTLMDSSVNKWTISGVLGTNQPEIQACGGVKSLSGVLTQIRLTSVGGAAAFDNGNIAIRVRT